MEMQTTIITLTTDFGEGSFYIAQMKGVILSINKNAKIFDISHSIKRHNIFEGAFIISQIWKYFPKGTFHIGVIDPGVGSKRKELIIETENCYFIGPDNGLFSLALEKQKLKEVISIDEKKVEKFTKEKTSKTFHGRDIFAPVAALISKGYKPINFGSEISYNEIKKLHIQKDEVIYIDSFGNIVLSLEKRNFCINKKIALRYKNKIIPARFVAKYADGKKGEFLLLEGSHGFLELSLREGSAAKKLKAKIGDKIDVK